MGSDSPKYKYDYDEDLEEQLEREKQAALEQHRRYLEYSVEQNRRRNRAMLQAAQNSYDDEMRDYIIKSQKLVGYNLNPYGMSSNDLEYWSKKIQNEIDLKIMNNFK